MRHMWEGGEGKKQKQRKMEEGIGHDNQRSAGTQAPLSIPTRQMTGKLELKIRLRRVLNPVLGPYSYIGVLIYDQLIPLIIMNNITWT